MSKKVKEIPIMRSICFWCGEMKDEILVGKQAIPKEKIKREVVRSYEPCETCAGEMSQGITCVEVDAVPWSEGQPSMGGAYPSGRWNVVTEDGIKGVIEDGELLDSILEKRKVFIEKDAFSQMFVKKDGGGNDE
jgi:hypothetical protein